MELGVRNDCRAATPATSHPDLLHELKAQPCQALHLVLHVLLRKQARRCGSNTLALGLVMQLQARCSLWWLEQESTHWQLASPRSLPFRLLEQAIDLRELFVSALDEQEVLATAFSIGILQNCSPSGQPDGVQGCMPGELDFEFTDTFSGLKKDFRLICFESTCSHVFSPQETPKQKGQKGYCCGT